MFKFFRNLRQKLLENGNVRKYFWYALGEILLVVIGILIALQINNWNEHRKERIVEKQIIQEIWIDLQINRNDLLNSIERQEAQLSKVSELSDHLIFRKQSYDSLGFHLREASSTEQFEPRMIGHESLMAKGVDIIKNLELRQRILWIYGLQFQRLIKEGREYEQFDNPTKDLLPLIKKHLMVDVNSVSELVEDINEEEQYQFETYGLTVKNYEALFADEELKLVLQKSMFNRAYKIGLAKKLVHQIEMLLEMIEQEYRTNDS